VYCVTNSNRLEKSLKRLGLKLLFSIFFLPGRLYAQSVCSQPLTVSHLIIENQKYFSLNCKVPSWNLNDLIGIKSEKGNVVGLLQLEKIVQAPKYEKETENIDYAIKKNESELKENIISKTKPEVHIEKRSLEPEEKDARDEALRPSCISHLQTPKSILKLISLRDDRILQSTDSLEKLDLIQGPSEVDGTTYLWKSRALPIETKLRYRPLYTQGETIGETAQTLWENEYYFSAFGSFSYGITDKVTTGSSLTGLLLGSPNGKIKGQVYRNTNQTWSVSLSMAQERSSSEKLFNIDLMWDSILSDTLVAHSLISAAVISFDSAKDVAALKSYGSSSIQTGYEYIFTDWSRFLVGPSYNIDQKAIGGYLAYLKIINNLHLQASLTTSNIRELKLSAEEGYFFILEAYWRW
jgi:hypothetical protein